ncbi:MAG: Cation diffusionfacilitator family transporter [Parcubacteria group bacterium GW2011_GWC2_39_14]|nr:MAG: Cation diffusionfacilitator family transporter [Parcubacteria group bacterium GW2011_GWC2_39_14]
MINTQKSVGYLPVVAALLGNLVVMTLKFISAFISGSATMFSEAIHSLADSSNQILLFIGIKRSVKKPSESFIYGYGRERFL